MKPSSFDRPLASALSYTLAAVIVLVSLLIQGCRVVFGTSSSWTLFEVLCLLAVGLALAGVTFRVLAEKRLASIGRLDDQASLAAIATADVDEWVRGAAVKRLDGTDQAVLAKIARDDADFCVQEKAIEKLTDQRALAEIARKEHWGGLRLAATRKITDQAVLAELAQTDANANVRMHAVQEINDQSILTEIAKTDKAWQVRIAAARNLRDAALAQAVCTEIVQTGDDNAQQAAVQALTDALLSNLSPVFAWAADNYVGENSADIELLRSESRNAQSWLSAKQALSMESTCGKAAAEYHFNMAAQAQRAGLVKEAWAGFHEALRHYAALGDERMIGLTCFELGKAYGAQSNWKMAQLAFRHSAFAAHRCNEREGRAWAIFYLGDTYRHLDDSATCRRLWWSAIRLSTDNAATMKEALGDLNRASRSTV